MTRDLISRRAALAGVAATAAAPLLAQPLLAQQRRQAPAPAQPAPPAGEARFALTIAPAKARLRPQPAPEFDVWAVDGATPGRPLRMKLGQELVASVRNGTDQPIALHWHGVRGPAATDGVGGFSQEPIAPGATGEARLTPPDAGTFFYRPIVLGQSGPLQDRGVTGALIVEERAPPPADADHVIVIDDWLLTDDNRVAPFETGPGHASAGRLGSWITVNGRSAPERIPVAQGSRVRLRLINACNARIMRLRFEGLRPYVIAVDGQPTDSFEPLRASLPFMPGSRYDLLVDVPADPTAIGTVVAQIGPGVPLALISAQARQPNRPPLPPIGPMPANELLPPAIRLQDSLRAEMVIEGGARPNAEGRLDFSGVDPARPWTVNGAAGDAKGKPLFSVPRGRPVVLALTNRTAWPQVLHVHGHAFRLLHPLDDGWEPYWLDTVQIPEGRTLRISFRTESAGRWLISSGVIERFDAGLWSWFEVT